MTETEFQEIGKQVLNVKDPQNLVPPFLEHYHNWLGGHTKGLLQLEKGENSVKSWIASATLETRDKVLEQLKAEIDKGFQASVKQLCREQPEVIKLLTAIAATGGKGFYTNDQHDDDIMLELMNRNSKSTLLRKVGQNDVRIHRYSHALYLHGVTEPEYEKAKEKIAAVKEMFGMNAKAKSA